MVVMDSSTPCYMNDYINVGEEFQSRSNNCHQEIKILAIIGWNPIGWIIANHIYKDFKEGPYKWWYQRATSNINSHDSTIKLHSHCSMYNDGLEIF